MRVKAESGKGSVRTPGPSMIRRMMRIPSDAARRPDHRRESVADPATRSFLSCHPSWKGNVLSAAACRMYRGRARPSCHGGGCGWAGEQKSSYNARHAGVAQLVERRLPKPEVASSRLVARSTFHHRRHHRVGGHGVQAHGQPLQGPQPSTSRSVPGRGSQRISAPGTHLISPQFSWQRQHQARHHVSPQRCAGHFRCLSRPGSMGRIGITSEACAGSESLPERGQVHECLSRACPARKRKVPALPAHDRAAPGPGAVTVSRAAPVGHAGWRHLPSARTTLR